MVAIRHLHSKRQGGFRKWARCPNSERENAKNRPRERILTACVHLSMMQSVADYAALLLALAFFSGRRLGNVSASTPSWNSAFTSPGTISTGASYS